MPDFLTAHNLMILLNPPHQPNVMIIMTMYLIFPVKLIDLCHLASDFKHCDHIQDPLPLHRLNALDTHDHFVTVFIPVGFSSVHYDPLCTFENSQYTWPKCSNGSSIKLVYIRLLSVLKQMNFSNVVLLNWSGMSVAQALKLLGHFFFMFTNTVCV